MSTSLRRYYRGDELVGLRDSQANATRYYHFDHQGTTQCLTDRTGAVTDRFASDAWGVEVKRTGNSINRQWYVGNAGYYRQQNRNELYVRARVFRSPTARWLSIDDIKDQHPFSYVANRPVLLIDASGLLQCAPVAPIKYTRGCLLGSGGPTGIPYNGMVDLQGYEFFRATATIRCQRDASDPSGASCDEIKNKVNWAFCQYYTEQISSANKIISNVRTPGCADTPENLAQRALYLANGIVWWEGGCTHSAVPWTSALSGIRSLNPGSFCNLTCDYEICMWDNPGFVVSTALHWMRGKESECYRNQDELQPRRRLPLSDLPIKGFATYQTFLCDKVSGKSLSIAPVTWWHRYSATLSGGKVTTTCSLY